MHELFSSSTPATDWDRVRPVLDDAMRELTEPDREAVLLRYFEKRPFADIGTALRVTEDAARMRVDRALEKLHVLLARRGVTSTAAALGVALSNQAITAAPAGLATAITGTALSGGLAAGGLATALKGFAFMNMSNLSTSVAVLAALAALGVAVRETRAERMITLTLATATQENQNAAAHLRELTQRG